MFTISLLLALSVAGFADIPGTNCTAIYQVPEGHPYVTKGSLRPPYWTANRWECWQGGLSTTEFENSPANGTDTEFQLAIQFVIDFPVISYYPILYVDEELLKVHINDELPPGSSWSVNQGTGMVTFTLAPGPGDTVTFDIEP